MSTALPQWNYFRAIEDDLVRCARYVEFTADNMKTHSIQFAQIILRAGAEADVAVRALTGTDNGKWPKLRARHPQLVNRWYGVTGCSLELRPWVDWNAGETTLPSWWVGYTAIKHDREAHPHAASLHNALNATAGLLSLILERFRRMSPAPTFDISQAPRLLFPLKTTSDEWEPAQISWNWSVT